MPSYDVFLSHSNKDKSMVRPLAERLQRDGLTVWFDEWEIKPGDSVPAKIEDGLEQSRVLVLCMSANAFSSDWARLEAGTFRFRDPLNKERRFIPLRLDDVPIKGSLAQFLFIDWRQTNNDQEYKKLLDACRSVTGSSSDKAAQSAMIRLFKGETYCLNSQNGISCCALSKDGKQMITGSSDNRIRIWDLSSGTCMRSFGCHRKAVCHIEWSLDCRRALVWNDEDNVRLLDLEQDHIISDYGKADLSKRQMDCFRLLAGGLSSVAIQRKLRLWTVTTEEHLQELRKKLNATTRDEVRSIVAAFYGTGARKYPPLNISATWLPSLAWLVERDRALGRNGEKYRNLRLCSRFDRGQGDSDTVHLSKPWDLAWRNDRRLVATGVAEKVVRIWDTRSNKCLMVFEGHTDSIVSLAWNPKLPLLLSADNAMLMLWDLDRGRILFKIYYNELGQSIKQVLWSKSGLHAYLVFDTGLIQVREFSPLFKKSMVEETVSQLGTTISEQIIYANAKVLLVGESGVGKTGLSNYLAHGIKVEDDKPLPSTDGAWATHWPLRHEKKKSGVDREIWLWDFAGQVDYRLVHQLFMDDTTLVQDSDLK